MNAIQTLGRLRLEHRKVDSTMVYTLRLIQSLSPSLVVHPPVGKLGVVVMILFHKDVLSV